MIDMDFLSVVDEKKQLLEDTALFLWEHPETAFTEFESAKYLCKVLRDEGFEVTENLAGISTAFCGRFGSVITTAPLEPTPRPYTDPYEYCTFCGACTRRCPVNAMDVATGKNMPACVAFTDKHKVTYAPRHGCGKCQLKLPCTTKRPGKA